jgi:fibronectin type 3 domain-containing protein
MIMKKIPAPYAALICLPLCLGACADLFQDKIPKSLDSSREGSLETLVNPPRQAVITELSPPAQLFVETGGSPHSIRLGWTSVEGASSYVVERAAAEPVTDGFGNIIYPLPAEEDFEILELFVYGLSYTDRILDNPVYNSPEYRCRYYYRVRSENVGAGLDASEATEAGMGVLFAPPRNVKAGKGESTTEIVLEWGAVDKAAAYRVYRSDFENGASPYQLARVNGPRYVNNILEAEQGREFYYSVAAETASGELSVASGLAMGFSLMAGAPDQPEDAGLAPDSGRGNGTSQIKIEWASVADADYYIVFRYSSEDAALTRLTENTTATSWTDTKQLKPQVYYYYQVQAVNEEDGKILKSQFSEAVEAFILSPPATAEALKAENGDISVQWYPALGAPAEQAGYSYEVYGDNDAAGSFSTLVATVSAPAAVQGDGYIHVDNAAVYKFYRIVTVNGEAKSQPGTPFAPPPLAAVILDASRAVYFSGSSPNANGVYPVKITWKRPDGETPAAYHVYRSADPASPGRPVTASPVPASAESGGEFTWVDENGTAKVGTYYYYRVLSLNTLGQGKYYSETKTGYGALTPEAFFKEYIKTVNSSLNKLVNMNKPKATDKLGDETKNGTISGSIAYDSPDSALSAIPPFTIYIKYTDYADFYIGGDSAFGRYFILAGQSNTYVTSMSGDGTMNGTVNVTGMYSGSVNYDKIVITGQVANGGVYTVAPTGVPSGEVSWTLGKR